MAMPPESKELLYALPGSAAEHRLRIQHAAEDRAALRTSELAAQVSPMNDIEERIRIWERLHALRLPRTEGHALVGVIATQTCLTVSQVREEQKRRAAVAARSKTSQRQSSAVASTDAVPPAAPDTRPHRD